MNFPSDIKESSELITKRKEEEKEKKPCYLHFIERESILVTNKMIQHLHAGSSYTMGTGERGAGPESRKHVVFSAHIPNHIFILSSPLVIKIQLLTTPCHCHFLKKIILPFLNKFAHAVPEMFLGYFYSFLFLTSVLYFSDFSLIEIFFKRPSLLTAHPSPYFLSYDLAIFF